MGSNLIRLSIVVMFLSGVFATLLPQTASADNPNLELPWTSGGYSISGYSYGLGDHVGSDYYAIDFGVPSNTPVAAAAGGVATIYWQPTGCGYYVVIDHGNNRQTYYCHLNSFNVSNGQTVHQGDIVGYSDSTGYSSGPHLHFMMRDGTTPIMPEPMSNYTGFGNYSSGSGPTYYHSKQNYDVLTNGSFENSGVFPPWQHDAGLNWARYPGGISPSGGYYLEMNTGSFGSGASISQNFPVNTGDWSNDTTTRTLITPGNTWTFRVWLRSADGSPVSGSIILQSTGGSSTETAVTYFNVTGWTQQSVTLQPTYNGNNRLIVTIRMTTTGKNYDVDGASLKENFVSNSSFESGGFSSWNLYHSGSCTPNWATYSSSARDAARYLEANRGTCTSGQTVSLYQDVTAYPKSGEEYVVYIWVRSPSGATTTGAVTLSARNGGTVLQSATQSFTSSGTGWQEVAVVLTLGSGSTSQFRLEIYMNTNGQNYDFDGVQLFRA